MAPVVQIYSETIQDFIRRSGGVANTRNIATRFGLEIRDAYKELLRLERARVVSRRGVGPLDDVGMVQNWEAA